MVVEPNADAARPAWMTAAIVAEALIAALIYVYLLFSLVTC